MCVQTVLVPAIQILQARANQLGDGSGRDARLLEAVRSRWCAMIEKQMLKEKLELWSIIFNTIMSDETSGR